MPCPPARRAVQADGEQPDAFMPVTVGSTYFPKGVVDQLVGASSHDSDRGLWPAHVILSEAKDLMPVASGDEVLRYAQDDMNHDAGQRPALGRA